MLCSIAYFFALLIVSCCSDVTFGKPAPSIPGKVRYFAPGPNRTDEIFKLVNPSEDLSKRIKNLNVKIRSYQLNAHEIGDNIDITLDEVSQQIIIVTDNNGTSYLRFFVFHSIISELYFGPQLVQNGAVLIG